MADIAQLVRALVCGTKCRRFESGYPPHDKTAPHGVFFIEKNRVLWYNTHVQRTTFGRLFLLPATRGCFLWRIK